MTETTVQDSMADMKAKPGWQTSEFYLTLLTALLPLLTAAFHQDFSGPQVQAWATVAAGVATVAYSLSRAHGKKAIINAKATMVAAAASPPAVQVNNSGPVTAVEPSPMPAQSVAVPIETLAEILARLDELSDAVKTRTSV